MLFHCIQAMHRDISGDASSGFALALVALAVFAPGAAVL